MSDSHAVSTPRPTWVGIGAVSAGAILLGAKGVLAKVLYARGLDYETVVSLRAVLAVPGFVILAMVFGGLRALHDVTVRDYVHAIAAGITCYAFGASVNFYALTLIDASVERALLFSYPAMVVMILWVISGNRPRPVTTIAVLATWIGIALTVGLFDRQLLQQNMLGAAWVLVCSATIAYYFLVSARLTRSMGSAQFTVVAMTAAATVLAARYEWRHDWLAVSLDTTTWLWMLALVVFVTVLPLYLIAEGVRRVGAQRGAIASTLGPPSAVILAIVVLGETVSISQFFGIALIVGGIASLERRSQVAAT